MLRKFFDPAIAEPATQPQSQPSIAELLAKHGQMNNTDSPAPEPITIQETKEDPNKAPESTPAATANETQNAEQANPETPSPEKEVTAQPTPQKEEAAKPQPSWQEVLKSQQPNTVLKELGYDDTVIGLAKKLQENPKMAAFFNHWETKGDVKDFLRELTTDYKEMPAEEVMRHQLRKDYPNASNAAIDVLYKKEIIKAYGLDSDDETELQEGRLLLEAKADRYRTEMIANQEKFLIPPAPEPKIAEPDNSEQLVQQEINAQKSYVSNSEYFRNIAASKTLSIGEGEDKFTYPVENPAEIIDLLYDSEKWISTISDVKKQEDGKITITPKTETQFLTGMVAKYGKAFLDTYAKHYKSLGGKAAIAPIENAKDNSVQSVSPEQKGEPKTIAEAMARQGQMNSGGYSR
jgi:hypothetical protein